MGKILSEVERAYLAGLLDADGAIMALIEPHKEKKFKFRVRIELKVTQKEPYILKWIARKLLGGKIKRNRTTFDWVTRDQKEIYRILKLLFPFLKVKRKQANGALKIISTSVKSKSDLLRIARLADALSINNVRSRKRRKNFATMIEGNVSPND